MNGMATIRRGGSLPLAPKVAAPRQRFYATPSPGLRPGPLYVQQEFGRE